MRPTFTALPTSIELIGTTVAGAEDRQRKISGFDQDVYSASEITLIGGGGLGAFTAPAACRKGIGSIKVIDDDRVEPSNLNRQRFYSKDLFAYKAVALAENLQGECIRPTRLVGHPVRIEEAIDEGIDLSCDVAMCGVDNNPARVASSRYFRDRGIPVIFTAVSADGDHGYVFVQDAVGACFGCLFPDAVSSERYPCPGTPAILDILQAVGALAIYALDTLLMSRPRTWNYRRIGLADGVLDGLLSIPVRDDCPLIANH